MCQNSIFLELSYANPLIPLNPKSLKNYKSSNHSWDIIDVQYLSLAIKYRKKKKIISLLFCDDVSTIQPLDFYSFFATCCSKWDKEFTLDMVCQSNPNPSSIRDPWRVVGSKWQNTPFAEKFQQNASCLKLFRNMPLFWNSILSKSSFSVELEFLENIQVKETRIPQFFF